MSERAAMKRRVRGLLRRNWLPPLAALLLAALPLVAACVIAFFMLRAIDPALPSVPAQIGALLGLGGETSPGMEAILASVMLLMTQFTNLINLSRPIAMIPALAVFLGVYLFIWLPVSVSVSGYFNGFLRGRGPKPFAVYSCFSGEYPRALGGMLYMALWAFLWMAAALAGPVLLYTVGVKAIEAWLGLFNQVYALGVLVVVCAVWFVVFTLLSVNRMLAYSLTSVCVASQPRLPARRAVRLSRKLMRGNKWRMIRLIISCGVTYFLPAILAIILLFALPMAVTPLQIASTTQWYIRLALWVVVGLNAPLLLYVAPYTVACYHAFYIERKREALLDAEVTQEDFTAGPKREQARREKLTRAERRKAEKPSKADRKARREAEEAGTAGDERDVFSTDMYSAEAFRAEAAKAGRADEPDAEEFSGAGGGEMGRTGGAAPAMADRPDEELVRASRARVRRMASQAAGGETLTEQEQNPED